MILQARREEIVVPNEGLKAKEVHVHISQSWFYPQTIDQHAKDLFEGPGGDIHPRPLGLFNLQVVYILFNLFTTLFTFEHYVYDDNWQSGWLIKCIILFYDQMFVSGKILQNIIGCWLI